uniref:Uncharacterized protein n=1 Tax=Cacopsylla melanoneura TaxID=428564 RepID=A0A8D8LEB2_9HEMI
MQRLNRSRFDSFVHVFDDFSLVGRVATSVHEGVEEDAVECGILQEHGHAKWRVVRQVQLSDFQESSRLGQTANGGKQHLAGQRVEHKVHAASVGLAQDVLLKTGVTGIGEIFVGQLREFLLQKVPLVFGPDSGVHSASQMQRNRDGGLSQTSCAGVN